MSQIEIKLLSAMACPEAAGHAGQVLSVREEFGKSLIKVGAAELVTRQAQPSAVPAEQQELIDKIVPPPAETPADFKRNGELVPSSKEKKGK